MKLRYVELLAYGDFTMNSMALPVEFNSISFWSKFNAVVRPPVYPIEESVVHFMYDFIDPYDGREDIEERFIHTVGRPIDRFSADPTRILRALKFALRLDFQLSAEIQDVLWERQDELCSLYEQKINPDRSCNELVQVFKQAPAWRVLQTFERYIPPSLLRVIFCGTKINLYPSLKS